MDKILFLSVFDGLVTLTIKVILVFCLIMITCSISSIAKTLKKKNRID